MEAIAMPT